MAIQMEVYMVKKLFFIFTVNHTIIFHQLLNGRDYFDTIPKYQNQIDTIKILITKLKCEVKNKNQFYNLPRF